MEHESTTETDQGSWTNWFEIRCINDKTMEEQAGLLDKAFEDWHGNLDQVDDVCVIGVRI